MILWYRSSENDTLAQEEWTSILKLATKWMMLDIRDMAIKHLTSLTIAPVDRLILAQMYGVIEWSHSTYIELVKRKKSISIDETSKLGLEAAIKISQTRDRILRNYHKEYKLRYAIPSKSPGLVPDYSRAIDQIFEGELQEEVASLDPVERVFLARTYGVSEWLRSAYSDLVERENGITLKEAERLGLETTVNLYEARGEGLEVYREHAYNYTSGADYKSIIDKDFETELQEVRLVSDIYYQFKPVVVGSVLADVDMSQRATGVGTKKKKKKFPVA